MKVLRVVGGLEASFGGPSVASVEECIASQRAGIATTLAFPCPEGDAPADQRMVEQLLVEGVAVHWFRRAYSSRGWSRRWGFSPSLVLWLGRSARSFDVVHFHGAWTFTTLAGSIVAKVVGRPVVLSPHAALMDFDIDTSGPFSQLVKRTLRRGYLDWFDLIIAASKLESRDSRHGVSRARVVALHHPVGSLAPSAPLLVASTSGNLRIGFLGRLDPKKNVDLLIRVLARLPDKVTLHIAGEGPPEFSVSLKALARECRVNQRVEWLGFVSNEEKNAFFESIDLLALPSVYECFGMAAAEAMMAGVPVLVSPACGIAEVVAASGGGFVAAPTDDAIEQILRSVFIDRSQLGASALRAVASARSEFSLEVHGTRLRREYESLLGCRALDSAPPPAEPVRERE